MNINNNNKIQLGGNVLVPIDVKEQEFKKLMLIYKQGMEQVQNELKEVQTSLNKIHDYDVISNINSRIKTPESIIKKMEKKNYDLNYKNLISNVNDIAGVRIVCPFKDDIVKVKNVLENNSKLEILEEKDYINKPKISGYSGYHIIAQTPVDIGTEQIANVKVEIQIRTMAMDFWSTTEHKIKYKANNKLSKKDSKKMVMYAKMINRMDEKISKLNSKYDDKKDSIS